MGYPCPCKGCDRGRHANGKTCRYCSGKGYYLATDWVEPCTYGSHSGDSPPSRGRHHRVTSYENQPLSEGELERQRQAESDRLEQLERERVKKAREIERQRAALALAEAATRRRADEAARRSADELGRILNGCWSVTVNTGGASDLQDVKLSRHALRKSRYQVASRTSAARADGSWKPLNGSQIQVDALVFNPGFGYAPFRPVITFEVMDGQRLRANSEGVSMEWNRV